MPPDVATFEKMLQAAAQSWRSKGSGAVEDLIQHLRARLSRNGAEESSDIDAGRFTLDLSDIHLNGLDEDVPCVLIGDPASEAMDAAKAFWREAGAKEAIPFVFCLSHQSQLAIAQMAPRHNALVLSPSNVVDVLTAEDPRMAVKQLLWLQITRARLNPYNFLRPAEGNMFFGRQDELSCLVQDRQSSYAIAGPSRVGKSSLLKRYARELLRLQDPRRQRTFFVDCYDCPDGSSDSVARHIAVRMGEMCSVSRAAHRLPQFLKSRSQSVGGPIELLLDEVDDVCFSRAFNYLAEAARHGHVRLVLCGRANLLNMMHKRECHLAQRLKLLRPEPLQWESAHRLITLPLIDLGFKVCDRERLVTHFLNMTGRLPGLLQYYGATIVDCANQRLTDRISLDLVRHVDQQLETIERFLEPILGLNDDRAMELAIRILRDDRLRYEPGDITRFAVSVLNEDHCGRIVEISNRLLIQGVLVWEHGGYRIGNGAIRQFARRFGLLNPGRVV